MAHAFPVHSPLRMAPANGETVPPPNSMPGYCVAIPTPDQPDDEAIRSAIVVEMGWAEQQDSLSYIHGVPFGVGARILYAA